MRKPRKKNRRDIMTPAEMQKAMGPNLSFAAVEAYKRLRANLNFSLPDVTGCKIIGITSALRGEGKSTTAVNLAYTMAQTGQKVLLLEADMRLPTLAKRLRLEAAPGLSNLLAGQCDGTDILQTSGLLANMWVAAAGDIPPNPAELLGSGNMDTVMKTLAALFDVIIVDLPPIMAVSDTIVVSRKVHGMVIVVRQDRCDRASVDESIRQLRFANTKILGFVMTGASTPAKSDTYYGGYRLSGREDMG